MYVIPKNDGAKIRFFAQISLIREPFFTDFGAKIIEIKEYAMTGIRHFAISLSHFKHYFAVVVGLTESLTVVPNGWR